MLPASLMLEPNTFILSAATRNSFADCCILSVARADAETEESILFCNCLPCSIILLVVICCDSVAAFT
ncbi:Uncharacterised protein [Vibrio cholerae]|nr:Uncharacterised protein [Vibrio cholerae]